jgi:fimbrial chaperone protein
MMLTATEDIVFFPPLLTVAPREDQKIRVGIASPAGPIESSYRLFIEQMPDLKVVEARDNGQVQVLMKFGIPIFVAPKSAAKAGKIGSLTMKNGSLDFEVVNTGTEHFDPGKVRVTGYDIRDTKVFSHEISGWYILAGGARDYQLHIPGVECSKAKQVMVEVQTGGTKLSQGIALAPHTCNAL